MCFHCLTAMYASSRVMREKEHVSHPYPASTIIPYLLLLPATQPSPFLAPCLAQLCFPMS